MVVQAGTLVLNASVKNIVRFFKCFMDCDVRALFHCGIIICFGGKAIQFISPYIGLLEL